MNESIVGVVVTFNRLDLLKNCITSLKRQTRSLDQIIVVNNGSTDGTEKWLNEQQGLIVIHQENSGGAGGFHRGMKEGYEHNYDWIWVMDDD
ncbi:MAG: glycosyltransferase, partial [Sphingobacteriaceae bacterium]